jgi:hypothetical protein
MTIENRCLPLAPRELDTNTYRKLDPLHLWVISDSMGLDICRQFQTLFRKNDHVCALESLQ